MADITSYTENVSVGRVCEELVSTVKITASQMLALNATPVQLVAAPGTTNALEFVSATIHKPAGTAFVCDTGDDIAIKYTDGSGAQVNVSLETTGFLDVTTAQTRITPQIASAYVPVVNAALVAHMLTGEVTTGNSPLYVRIRYRKWHDVTDDPST